MKILKKVFISSITALVILSSLTHFLPDSFGSLISSIVGTAQEKTATEGSEFVTGKNAKKAPVQTNGLKELFAEPDKQEELFREKTKREKIVVFVIDTFRGSRSHGMEVSRVIRKNGFINRGEPFVPSWLAEEISVRMLVWKEKYEIRHISLGQSIERSEYLKTLGTILDYAQNNPNVSVVLNLSFGSYRFDLAEAMIINELVNKGIIIIAAAGNENTNKPIYPAAYKGVITVAAVDRNGAKAEYSNYGSHVDIAAVGHLATDIVSKEFKFRGLNIETRTTYLIRGGTSFAAPRVTGLIAYLLYQRPDLSGSEIVKLIKETAQPVKDFDHKSDLLGTGLINVHETLLKADETYRAAYTIISTIEIIGFVILLLALNISLIRMWGMSFGEWLLWSIITIMFFTGMRFVIVFIFSLPINSRIIAGIIWWFLTVLNIIAWIKGEKKKKEEGERTGDTIIIYGPTREGPDIWRDSWLNGS